MSVYILAVAVILIICLLFSKFSTKIGLPTLLVFIFLGMLFGSDGLFKIQFDNYDFAEQICSISLIFIMFYGGFGTNWRRAKKIASKSILLSTAGVILTAVLTGLFCYSVLQFDLLESFLIGAVLSPTDAASVFSILRSKKLNLKHNTASLLEVESGSNDPCAYMLTILLLELMQGDASGGKMLYMIFAQVVFGALIGVAAALLSAFVLKKTGFSVNGFDSIFVFATALASYAGAAVIGGNGYLSAYITGIILGNMSIPNKKSLVNFFDGITGLMQILIFFLLGLLSFPSQLPRVIIPAIFIALFITFIARPLIVFGILTPFGCPVRQQILVSWSGLRGASSIVFAITALVSSAQIESDLFNIVFLVVLFSIAFQGTLIPFAAKKLDMIDDKSDVMKTFNDYTEEVPVQFIKLPIKINHPWANKKVKNIHLLPNTILALIIRGDKRIVPRGNTVVQPDDIVVMSGSALESDYIGSLTELEIDEENEWIGESMSNIKFDDDKLVILIRRGNRVIFPTGKTTVKQGDVLIINQSYKSPQKSMTEIK